MLSKQGRTNICILGQEQYEYFVHLLYIRTQNTDEHIRIHKYIDLHIQARKLMYTHTLACTYTHINVHIRIL